MTDAMHDPLLDETPPPVAEESVSSPSLGAFRAVVERLEHLEANEPAISADEEPEDELTQARLTRHRGEIEQLKRTVNALIEYVTTSDAPLPTAIPAAPVAAAATTDPTSGVTP